MAESQLDRIENMLKIMIESTTTIQLTGTAEARAANAAQVSTYSTAGEPQA
jgi:hypothetical protein